MGMDEQNDVVVESVYDDVERFVTRVIRDGYFTHRQPAYLQRAIFVRFGFLVEVEVAHDLQARCFRVTVDGRGFKVPFTKNHWWDVSA
jgi:hypothetical protein